MLKLFKEEDKTKYSKIINKQWRVIKDNFNVDLLKVTNYYNTSSRRVNNNNTLSKSIRHMNIKVELSIYSYLEILDSTYKYTLKDMGVSSGIHQGKLIDNLIGVGERSVVLDVNFEIDLFNIKDTWKTQSPLRPIKSDIVDINLAHPTDMRLSSYLTVYELDARLMMVMFKYWSLEQIEKEETTDPSKFVYNYVLTNTIGRFLDLSILNKFLSPEIEKVTFVNTHPFIIRDQTNVTNNFLRYMQKKLRLRNIFYEELMLNIPTVTVESGFELLESKGQIINRQNIWSQFLARADIFMKIIYFLGPKGIKKNHKHYLDLYLYMLQLRASRMMSYINFKQFEEDTELVYDFLLEISKKRSL